MAPAAMVPALMVNGISGLFEMQRMAMALIQHDD